MTSSGRIHRRHELRGGSLTTSDGPPLICHAIPAVRKDQSIGPTADRGLIVPIQVLVVDDHEIVRKGVRFLLSDETQYHICGEAENGIGAIEKILELSPDVVVLDLIPPLMSGYETAARIRKISPLTKIIFFSVHEIPTSAQMLGADAFVPKSHLAEELASTIRSVVQSPSA